MKPSICFECAISNVCSTVNSDPSEAADRSRKQCCSTSRLRAISLDDNGLYRVDFACVVLVVEMVEVVEIVEEAGLAAAAEFRPRRDAVGKE